MPVVILNGVPYIKGGMKAKFFSHDSGKWYEAQAFEFDPRPDGGW